MKKLLALAILSASFSAPCFGVDFIRDRIYTSSSYSAGNVGYAIGYHYTDSIKISVEPMFSAKGLFFEEKYQGGILANLHYHYEFTNTDITSYISAGIGSSIGKVSNAIEGRFSYKISSGINLPLSSRTNIFAVYSLLKEFREHNYGLEFGMSFNL